MKRAGKRAACVVRTITSVRRRTQDENLQLKPKVEVRGPVEREPVGHPPYPSVPGRRPPSAFRRLLTDGGKGDRAAMLLPTTTIPPTARRRFSGEGDR
jgi:hypothetical protein